MMQSRDATPLVMIVWPTPAPTSQMRFVIFSVLSHVALPAGTTTMSPEAAAATATRTSSYATLAARIVAP